MTAATRKALCTRSTPAWIRVVREPGYSTLPKTQIREPEHVVNVIRERIEREPVEVFYLLTLDSQSYVTGAVEITRGLLNSSLVHPREVFAPAIAHYAAGIIVVHNHPSGDPTPSAEDRAVTRQLADAGRLLDIPLYDHVIIAGDKHFSFSAGGLL